MTRGMRAARAGGVARIGAIVAAALLALACAWSLVGCESARVDESSPQVTGIELSAASNMDEASQRIDIMLTFNQQISAGNDVLGDFTFLLNGSEVDKDAIALEARPSTDSVTISLRPASGAQGTGSGGYFATYQSEFSLVSARDDGALPSITGASGSCAVLQQPVTGVLPSGAAIETVDEVTGSAEANRPASTTIRVTSPAQVRAITWFSPDGGATKLLKHNHIFANVDAEGFAADLAKTVNATSGLGVRATAHGDEVTLRATAVEDGQKIEPCIVEGVGATAGTYDESTAMGGA